MERYLSKVIYKSIICMVLASILNLQVVGLVEAMNEGDEEVGVRDVPLQVRTSPVPSHSSVAFGQTIPSDMQEQSVVVQFHKDPQVRSTVEAFEAQLFADPDFMVSLSSWHEARRRDAELGSKTRKAVKVGAGVGAVGAGIATAELFMFSSVETLFGNGGVAVPPVPTNMWVAGTFAGALVLKDAYDTLHNGIVWYLRPNMKYKTIAQEDDRGKAGFYVLALGAVAGLTGKQIFTYVTVNLPPIPAGIAALVIICGVPYVGLKVGKAFTSFQESYSDFWAWAKRKWERRKGRRIAGEQAKEDMRGKFTQGFRKTRKEAMESANLLLSIHAINQFVEEITGKLRTRLEELKERYPKESDSQIQRAMDVEIATLEGQILTRQRVGDMLVLRTLYKFDEADAYVRKPEKEVGRIRRFRRWAFGGDHPWYDDTAQAVGAAGGLMASGALWFGWGYVAETIGLSPSLSTAATSVVTIPFTVYMAKKTGNKLRNVVRSYTGYNPIEGEEHISLTDLNWGALRGTLELIDWGIKTFTILPASNVGGIGMGNFIYPDGIMVDIPFNTGLWTLAPNFIAFGAAEPSGMQGWITDGKIKWSANYQAKAQQQVARIYGEADKFINSLKGRNAIFLREFLDSDPKTWFESRKSSPTLVATSAGDVSVADVVASDISFGESADRVPSRPILVPGGEKFARQIAALPHRHRATSHRPRRQEAGEMDASVVSDLRRGLLQSDSAAGTLRDGSS